MYEILANRSKFCPAGPRLPTTGNLHPGRRPGRSGGLWYCAPATKRPPSGDPCAPIRDIFMYSRDGRLRGSPAQFTIICASSRVALTSLRTVTEAVQLHECHFTREGG